MDTEEVLKKTQELVNFLLRYVVAGGSAVLVFGLTQQDRFSFLRVGNELSILLLLLFVSVIGPAIYSIHRALVHPLILNGIYKVLLRYREDKLKPVKLVALDRALSKQLEKWRKDEHQWLSTYEGWAAQIHFLYCSFFGITSALVLACLNQNSIYKLPILIIGVIILAAAILSDGRLTNLQIHRTLEDRGEGLELLKPRVDSQVQIPSTVQQ
jgi:hypothetical protein